MSFDGLVEVTFEPPAYELLLTSLEEGEILSAARLLTVLDGESEEALEDVFAVLLQKHIFVDISDIPRYSADSDAALRLRREEQLAKQGTLPESLEQTDPLRLYLEEIAQVPACGDIHVLAKHLAEDETVPGAIMNLYLRRIVELAFTYTGQGVLLMDLIQEGSMGLWESLCDYKTGDITQFCDDMIRWYMTKAVVVQAHAAGVGQKLRQAVEDYRSVDEKLLAELGRSPTMEEIAEALHLSVNETEMAAQILQTARALQHAKKPEPEQLEQEEDQAVEDTAYFQMRQRIADLLSDLSERDRELLSLRYGLEGGLPMSSQEVGVRLGMTPEEVNAAESAALAKLRQQN